VAPDVLVVRCPEVGQVKQWQTTTWDDLSPGEVVELDGVVEAVDSMTISKDGTHYVYLRGKGPKKVTRDQIIEVFK